jgi:uncharacterized protein (TIGR02246 family)
MKIRTLTPTLLVVVLAACSGYGGDAAEEADAAPELSADEQALAENAEYWVTHYNMGHPGMVAGLYAEDAWFLGSNGRLAEGREDIGVALGENAAGSPQIEVTPGGQMIQGEHAIGWGTYAITASPEGADPVSYGGTYLTHSSKIEGEWKIVGHIGNLTDDPPEGFAFTSPAGEPGPNQGTMADLEEAWETHFNLGHASMVADLYTDDGMVSFSRGGPVHGRAAITEALTGLMEANPSQIDVNDIATIELGDGWALDGGWYAMSPPDGGDPFQFGGYYQLLRQAADGSWQVHWSVANGWPAEGM